MEPENNAEKEISSYELLKMMGDTPADNREGYDTAIHWKSSFGGAQAKTIFRIKNLLDSIGRSPWIFGPLSLAADLQKTFLNLFVTDPIKKQAQHFVRKGAAPDIFENLNRQIEKTYAEQLSDFCGLFIKNSHFDEAAARSISTTADGEKLLIHWVWKFAFLEYGYSSLGLTRLKALKELMTTLLIVVTGKLPPRKYLPFLKNGQEPSTEEYMAELKKRLENLHNANAFNIIRFSEIATKGKIGCSRYSVVRGSRIYSVSLRYYKCPKGIEPNGTVLYLPTPLINKPEIFDLARGKSVIGQLLNLGYEIYMEDPGEPGYKESRLRLGFYGKTVHDKYLDLIARKHPRQPIHVVGYCIGGSLIMPYLARRAEERLNRGESMDIKKVVLIASPVKFDSDKSGHAQMRELISKDYYFEMMNELYADVNVPPQVIQIGMDVIQPGVQYTVMNGFFNRAREVGAIQEAAPFLYWLTHGTKYPARAHYEWLEYIFMENRIFNGTFCLPSSDPDLDGKPPNMAVLKKVGVAIMDYRGNRDPIAPAGSCVASEIWGRTVDDQSAGKAGMNHTIEKNIGHIFVVSKPLLAEFIKHVTKFFSE